MPSELQGLPLFPLQTVLFPGGRLPLRIFEVRYLDMIGRSHKAGTPFGVVCLNEGAEVQVRDKAGPSGDAYAREGFHAIGTLARINELERPQPGMMLIACTGLQRFRIVASERLKHGLWLADVEFLSEDAPVPVPDDLAPTVRGLQSLLEDMGRHAQLGEEPLVPPPHRWNDCNWVANRWCELLPLPPQAKQRLMALENPLLRLELVADALDQLGFSRRSDGPAANAPGPGA